MSNDGGLIAVLERWMADTLAALTFGGKLVFKTADIWRHQVSAVAGGIEAFERYEPFAFVGYLSADTAREGDNDLRQILEFAVLAGVVSKSDGVARFGDSNNLGISKIRDLVIAAFDRNRPGDESITCDQFYYTGDKEVPLHGLPKAYVLEMTFECSQLTAVN